MPKIHPKVESWRRSLTHLPQELREALRHALDCPACRPLLRELLTERAGREGAEPGTPGGVLAWRPPAPDYGPAVASALRSLVPRIAAAERQRAAAPVLLDELMRAAERDWAGLGEDPRFATIPLIDLLLERSREESYHDARRGERLALLALGLAERIEADAVGPRVLADARARTWAAVGNARRMATDLRGAEEAFERAEKELASGTHEPLEKARLLDLKASLLRAQRRFAEAVTLIERSIALYRRERDDHAAGRATLKLALAHKESGHPERAIEHLREAGRLIDPAADSRLNHAVRHNLIDTLVDAGRPLEARALLAKSRHLDRNLTDASTRLRIRWVEAKIEQALGRLDVAKEVFYEVRDGFIELGNGYDAALVSLNLASIYAEQGRSADMKRLAAQMLPVFRSRDVHREALAALAVFQQAAAAENAGLELVLRVRGFLDRARHDPSLRFEPAAAE